MENTKLHKGRIENWSKHFVNENYGLGYIILGRFLDHEDFAFQRGHTSWVVAHDKETGEVETRNSRYTLVGKEVCEY